MIKLNERLMVVAEMIDEDSQILDVGCDHAFLDIYLVERGLVQRAVASDNRVGPLEHAHRNIAASDLLLEIETRLGDGIDTIDPDIDTVVISGMGGLHMVGILKYKTELLKQVKTLVLSPNNDVERLRREIISLGFYIVDERLVQDRNFFYPVIKFQRGNRKYCSAELVYGPVLMQQKTAVFKEYILREMIIKEKILDTLPKKYWRRRREVSKELRVLKKIRND